MPCSAKNPLLKKLATQNERNFRVDFYAKDAIRLSPYKDDKLKYAENSPFWAGSDYSRLPKAASRLGFARDIQISAVCCNRGNGYGLRRVKRYTEELGK